MEETKNLHSYLAYWCCTFFWYVEALHVLWQQCFSSLSCEPGSWIRKFWPIVGISPVVGAATSLSEKIMSHNIDLLGCIFVKKGFLNVELNSTFRKPFLTNMYIFVNEEIINERKEKAYIFCNVKYFILRISRKSLNIYFKRSTWWLYSLHCSTKNYKKRNVHREKKSGTSSSFHKSLKLILTFESNSVYM